MSDAARGARDLPRSPATTGSAARSLDGVLLAGLCAVLVWTPVPLGSNRTWAWDIQALLAGILLLVWVYGMFTGRVRSHPMTARLAVPITLWLLAIGWAIFQTLPLGLVGVEHPVWGMAREILPSIGSGSIALNADRTWTAILRASSYAVLFFVAFQVARDQYRSEVILLTVVVCTLFNAFYGVFVYATGADPLADLIGVRAQTANTPDGTFVNPNHFATYLGFGTIAALAIFTITGLRTLVLGRGPRHFIRSAIVLVTSRAALPLLAMVCILVVILSTTSRGGLAASVAGLVVTAGAIGFARTRGGGINWARLAIPGTVLLVAIAALALSSSTLLMQLAETNELGGLRIAMAEAAWQALQSSPLLGSGFGNFVDYYPLYGDGRVYGMVDRAHNDYLEALADLGWIAGLCYLLAPIWVACLCIRGVLRRRKRTLPAVGLGIAAIIGLQSLVEFPMQIPAIAGTFAILLGMAAAQSWSSQETAPSTARTRPHA